MGKHIRGFTLIEAMIVVALIGIIVALGYPSYRDQVIKSRRSDGMAALLELADRMERHYSDVAPINKPMTATPPLPMSFPPTPPTITR